MKKVIAATVIATLALTGCLGKEDAKTPINQKETCMFSQIGSATCAEGQLALFTPNSWGNEQLPLYAASVFCDFNHPVVQNNGGVLCVFTKQRIKAEEKPAQK
ncbi:MAG: hypothetical protein WCI39_12720 [Gallionellaceae bacterium]